ncbi:MAG: YceH family protein [Phycisphaerales bacterium]
MLPLTRDECRVLGVLVEKALTTPAQYPLTLNSLVLACNQKNNRDPVTNLSEERVFDAIDGLRKKSLVREAMLSGSRVSKFRHVARETLGVSTEELVILTELLLRGPQAIGELRAHASRMHPLDSIEQTQSLINGLCSRSVPTGPLLKEIHPAPGQRAKRYVQLLCPDLHPLDAPHHGSLLDSDTTVDAAPPGPASPALEQRIASLESEVQQLKLAVRRLAASLGESDPIS